MFKHWLYSPRNYIMTLLMIVALYSLALDELVYSVMGQVSTGRITHVEQEETNLGPAKSRKVFTWNDYEMTLPDLPNPVEGRFQAEGLKVGDAVELQYVPGWKTWSRPATSSKPWLGWGVLLASIVVIIISVVLGREAQDPFAKARAQRHRT